MLFSFKYFIFSLIVSIENAGYTFTAPGNMGQVINAVMNSIINAPGGINFIYLSNFLTSAKKFVETGNGNFYNCSFHNYLTFSIYCFKVSKLIPQPENCIRPDLYT